MWMNRGFHFVKPATYLRRPTPFIDRDFQLRYTLLLLGASFLGMLLVVIPTYYFINQNYTIFVDLAYDHSPELLKYLEKERAWINTILFSVFVGLSIFFAILGFKMTARMVGPIKVLRNHLRHITRGHWYIKPVSVRDSDEFQDLIEAYNYFYSSFQSNLRKDLERVKSLSIDSSNSDAYNSWKELIEEKSAQLNAPIQSDSPQPIFLKDKEDIRPEPRAS